MPGSGTPTQRERAAEGGQSFVELALVLPVLLLLLLIAIDFGRVYLGYVNLQQMARVGANYAAEHASAWSGTGDATKQAKFQTMIANDAKAINCTLPVDALGTTHVPDPAFPGGFGLGDPVEVQISCSFSLIAPIIGQIVGNQILVSAGATFPVKEGAVATLPGGGGGPAPAAPVADFFGSPRTGYAPLSVTLTDTSSGGPTSWEWSFGNGSSFNQGPHTRTYDCDLAPGEICEYTVRLKVGNTGGFDTLTRVAYIRVVVPPASGPVAEFTATPRTGDAPLSVSFSYVPNGVAISAWEWDFDGNGTVDSTVRNPTKTYATPGVYTVTLTVRTAGGAADSQTKVAYIVAKRPVCTVPDFANYRKNQAQGVWTAAGFTTTVTLLPGSGNYTINYQSLLGGTIDPQPDGCASPITVGP